MLISIGTRYGSVPPNHPGIPHFADKLLINNMMERLNGSFICRIEECRLGIVTIVLLLKVFHYLIINV